MTAKIALGAARRAVAEPWRLLFDLGVRSFYIGEMDTGRWACERLLSLPGVPAHIREQTRRNQTFYTERLAAQVPSMTVTRIAFPTPERWFLLNPSIVATQDGYHLIVRSSNYTMDGMRYVVYDDNQVIRTTHYLVSLAPDLSVHTVQNLADETTGYARYPGRALGFEDARLFSAHGVWSALLMTREHSPVSLCQLGLVTLAGGAFHDLRLLTGPVAGRHEKNWIPLLHAEHLHFIYSCQPVVVLRCDEANGALSEIARRPGPLIADSFRGGSQALAVDDGYLFIVHESVDYPEGHRIYAHRFVFMDRRFAIRRISPQFFFLDRTVEFCAGLALRDGWLTASFGLRDSEAYLATMRFDEVCALLRPVRSRAQQRLVPAAGQ